MRVGVSAEVEAALSGLPLAMQSKMTSLIHHGAALKDVLKANKKMQVWEITSPVA